MRSRAPSLLLQHCYLAVIPTRLRPATAPRRLRIADNGAGLLITSADLDTLSALRSLTFLSLTQASSCIQYWMLGSRVVTDVHDKPGHPVAERPCCASATSNLAHGSH